MPQLIFYIEGEYPQVHHLSAEKLTIGRNKDNDIRVPCASVSVYHAELITMVDGSYQLKDLDSSNGTVINQETVSQKILTDGDKLKFGSVKAVYVDIKPSPTSRPKQIVGIEGLEKEAESLMRKTEIERNNLLLLRNEIAIARQRRLDYQEGLKEVDAWEKERKTFRDERQRALAEIEQALNGKKELESEQIRHLQELEEKKKGVEAEKNRLLLEMEQIKAELEKNRNEAAAAVLVIEKGKAIELTIGSLESDLKNHQSTLEALALQIADQEKNNEALARGISERQKNCDQIEIELADRNSELAELNSTIATRKKEVDQLVALASENNTSITSASQKLAEIDAACQRGRESLSQGQKMDEALKKESFYLSRLITEKSIILQRLKDKINARIHVENESFACPPLRVINPGMRSLMHYFHQGAGFPELNQGGRQPAISPSGIFALAACTKGSLHRDMGSILTPDDPILLLLSGDLEKDRGQIETITSQNPTQMLLVCWGEGQLNSLLESLGREPIAALLAKVSGHILIDQATADLLEKLDLGIPHLQLDLPCPIEVPEWNLSTPIEKRNRGVFFSEEGFDASSLLHRTRVNLLNQLVADTGIKVTRQDPKAVIEGLNLSAPLVTSTEGYQSYAEYLTLLGRHHFVMSFGKSPFGGDVFGDALQARTIYLGANYEKPLHELIFPDSCIKGDDFSGALEHARTVFKDQKAFLKTMKRSESLASQLYSFQNTRERLGELIHLITQKL
jgi:FHA domain